MKKLIFATVLVASGLGRQAWASDPGVNVNPADVSVYTQMDTTLGLTLYGATYYDAGSLTSNQVWQSGIFSVTNTGQGITETFGLRAIVTGQGGPAWALYTNTSGTLPGADAVAVDAAFNTTSGVTWNIVNHRLTAANVPATVSQFAGDATGVGVPWHVGRDFYVRLTAPSTATAATRQRVQVEILAAAP